jgi:peptidoglycan/LPS O-acetylase OafA/YrhL
VYPYLEMSKETFVISLIVLAILFVYALFLISLLKRSKLFLIPVLLCTISSVLLLYGQLFVKSWSAIGFLVYGSIGIIFSILLTLGMLLYFKNSMKKGGYNN